MATPARRQPVAFAVVPPSGHAALLLVVLGGVLPLAGVWLLVSLDPAGSQQRAWPVLLLFPAVLILLLCALRRRSVTLHDGVLDVRAGLHRLRVPVAELDLAHARIVDLDEHRSLRPFLRTFGMALPGYRAGHFRLRDRGRAFVLLTGKRRVLVLPQGCGRRVLLSLEQPRALLDALRNTPLPR